MRYGDSVGSGRRYSGVSRLCDIGSTVRVGVSGMVWCGVMRDVGRPRERCV